MVSHLKQRPGFTEHKVSHVELRPNSHRRKGLAEGRASQNARSHRKQSLTEGPTLWTKAGSQRRKGLTEGKASQKPGSHRRQDLTEGLTERQGFTEGRVWPTKQRHGLTEGRGVPSLVWLQACVSHMTQCRVSHNRQGNKGPRTWRCFHPWNHTLPNCCSLYCSHTRAALAHFLVGGRMTGPALDTLP